MHKFFNETYLYASWQAFKTLELSLNILRAKWLEHVEINKYPKYQEQWLLYLYKAWPRNPHYQENYFFDILEEYISTNRGWRFFTVQIRNPLSATLLEVSLRTWHAYFWNFKGNYSVQFVITTNISRHSFSQGCFSWKFVRGYGFLIVFNEVFICPKRRTKRNWPVGTQQTASSASSLDLLSVRNLHIKTKIDM